MRARTILHMGARGALGGVAVLLVTGFSGDELGEGGALSPGTAAFAIEEIEVPPVRDLAAEAVAADLALIPADPRSRRRIAYPVEGTAHAWRGLHGRVDGQLWRRASLLPDVAVALPMALPGIGFPALAPPDAPPAARRGRYRPMIDWHEPPDRPGVRRPIARVRCMGLRPAAVARRAARIEPMVVQLAIRHGVSAALVKAVITVESCFDPKAVSPVGAIGLMQLMPATARWLGVRDPFDARANLDGGIRYLGSLLETFGEVELALAAYNAGPGKVRRYGGIPPYAETRAYVQRVRAHHRRYAAATALASR